MRVLFGRALAGHALVRGALISGVLVMGAGAGTARATEAPVTDAESWSTYRGGNKRASYLAVDLASSLQLLWQHAPNQPPQPAWPAPARGSYWQELSKISPRVIDDHTFHPVLAHDMVLFGSSANDSVYCLEVATGKVRWRLTTDGPVRYAPCVAGERVYVGSDDGQVYCVNLASGDIIWQRRLGPLDRQIPGHGRLISPWPVRTSVAVTEGVAYVGAGLYPSQGVYVYALEAGNGNPVWSQKIDFTAHGYLLMSQDELIVPTGRSTPIVLHRSDGRFLAQLPGTPGSYAVMAGRKVLSGRGNDGSLGAADVVSHESLVSVPAQHICVTPRQSYLLGGDQLVAVDLPQFMQLSRQLKAQIARQREQSKQRQKLRKSPDADPLEIERAGALLEQLTDQIGDLESQRAACRLWQVATPHQGCLAATNNLLVLGGAETIELRDRLDGQLLAELPIAGEALGIGLSDRHLVVTTDAGRIYCFGWRQDAVPVVPLSEASSGDVAANPWAEKVADLAAEHLQPIFGSTQGYALVVGAGEDRGLLEALSRQTELTIVAVDHRPSLVESLRARLLQQGIYGSRVSVHLVAPGRLPFADYFANLVVSSRGLAGKPEDRWTEKELLRVLRPAGGVAWLSALQPPSHRDALAGAGRWDHLYGNTENTAASDDRLVHRELRLQWFGGPGPARMVDRHLRAPAPLVADGRMFVAGENSIVCVDSYHGTEYWQLDVPASQRYSMPYDCGYSTVDDDLFAIAVQDSAWLVDARTGQIKEKIPVPSSSGLGETHWGYLALKNDQLFGSIQKTTASRTVPSRDQVDRDYGNDRPIVTGTGLFLIDAASKQLRWQHDALVVNPTITISADRVYFVSSTDESLLDHASGRILLHDLLATGAELVALESSTGNVVWRRPLDPHMTACRNILYLQSKHDRLILSGSYGRDNDSWYRVAVLDANSGETIWVAEHEKGKPGAFTHGEQVHHPVILGNRLVCEPAIYELESGRRIAPGGKSEAWTLTRPEHSCGTMSGAGDCLFFRSGNPTVMDLRPSLPEQDRFRKISPTRPGCWINIIPADGLVLIPEASASCVCHYSLQTSMAFQPVPADDAPLP